MNFSKEFKKNTDIIRFLFCRTKNNVTNREFDLFHNFEVVNLNLETTSGNKMLVDTTSNDIFDEKEYMAWNTLSGAVKSYIQNNSNPTNNYSNLILNVRLRCPKDIYNKLNYNKLNEYRSFEFIVNINQKVSMVNTSSIENAIPVIFPEASMDWDRMFHNHILLWKKGAYIDGI